MKVLKEKGPEKLLDALTDIPRVGYIRTPDSLGYDLRFAYREPGEDGGEDITVITNDTLGSGRRSIAHAPSIIRLR